MIKRPFLWCAGAYVLGEVLALYGPGTALPLGALLLFAVTGKYGQSKRLMLALPFFFLAGMILAGRAGKAPAMDTVFEEQGKSELTGTISGKIAKIEERKEAEEKTEYRIWMKNCQVLLTEKEGTVYETGEILLLAEGESEDSWEVIEEGNRVLVTGKILAMEKPGNQGQFDSSAYYRAVGIDYMAKGSSFEIFSESRDLLRISLRKFKNWMADNLKKVSGEENENAVGILQAVVLGEKWAADEEIVELYTNAGIGHLLAISGLHLSLSGMGVYRLLKKKMKRSYLLSAAVCTMVSFCYFILTGEGTSAGRAFLMIGIYGAGQVSGRQYDLPSAAAFTALLMLIRQPLLLCQSGFQLSFGSVLALGLFGPVLEKMWEGRKRTEKIKKAVLPALSIQLFIFPIQAAFFYKIPVYGIFLNLLVLPLFPLIAVAGMAAAFLGGLFPEILRAVLIPAVFLLSIYEKLCRWSLKLPGSVLRTGMPMAWQFFIYGIFLVLLYRYMEAAEKTGRKEKLLFLGLFGICFFSMLPMRYDGLELDFLDVGQGDCCFIRTPEGVTFFIDGGSSSKSSPGESCIEPFLDSIAVGQVDYALVSHGDADHINGLEELIEKERICHLILPKGQENSQEELERLKEKAEQYGVIVHSIGQGETVHAGEVSFFCLWPEWKEGDFYIDENETSMVLWLSYRNFDALFTGDLEGDGEQKAAEYLKEWQAENDGERTLEILKVGHHGSANGTSEELLEEIRPLSAVISCGKNNRYGHPAEETLDRLKAAGTQIYRTDLCGAVRIRTDGKKLFLCTYREKY